MDSLSKDFLQELECPVCLEYMLPPITMCENGHNICCSCKPKLHKCPTCNGMFMNVRNITLEILAGKVWYPCKFKEFGCEDKFLLDHILKHQEQCIHGHYKCPFFITSMKCPWDGPASHIRLHIKSIHRDPCDSRQVSGVHNARLPSFDTSSAWCQAMFSLGEVFFRFSKLIDNYLYSCLLYVGPKDKAGRFNYRLLITSPDGRSSVSVCHETCWYETDIDEIFQSGNCAIFHREFAKSCMNSEKELIVEEEIFIVPS